MLYLLELSQAHAAKVVIFAAIQENIDMANYGQLPAKVLKKPETFKIEIPDKEIDYLKQLLKLSRLPSPTYESLQEDGRYGVSHKWMTEAKKAWENFNWYQFLSSS